MKLARRRTQSRHTRALLESLESRLLLTSYSFGNITSLTGDIGGGAWPSSLIADANGNLFGTTQQGGQFNYGTIFEIPAGTNQVLTLASFTIDTGFTPEGKLVLDANGNLFGTAANGGDFNRGTIWELPAGSDEIIKLWNFSGLNGGAYPVSGLVADASGNLWGTTLGNEKDIATVFEFTPTGVGTGTFQNIASFEKKQNIAASLATTPDGLLAQDIDGNVFGAAINDGDANAGFLFRVDSDPGSIPIMLASFDKDTNDGIRPIGSLLYLTDSGGDNVLVGITSAGGTKNNGTIFEASINGATATITTIGSFIKTNGARPLGDLIVETTGAGLYTMYGVTAQGGSKSDGIIYSANLTLTGATTDTAVITPLQTDVPNTLTFTKSTGTNPTGGLVMLADGSFIVTTASDGLFKDGTIVQVLADADALPDHLVVQQKSVKAIAGTSIGSIVVRAIDADGDLDTSFNGDVTLSILTGPSGGVLSVIPATAGTLTVTAVNGIATFPAGLTIEQSGTYSLVATDVSGLIASPGQSARVTIEPSIADHLTIVQQPISGSADSPIGEIIVNVEDEFGNIIIKEHSKVELTIAAGPGGARIRNASAKAIDGVATFRKVSLTLPGVYTLEASYKELPVAALAPITIGPAAEQLEIIVPPTAVAGTSFTVTVNVEDGLGAVLVDDTSPVTISVLTGGKKLFGTFTVEAINGVVTFPDFAAFDVGTTIRLLAKAGDLSVTSGDILIVAPT